MMARRRKNDMGTRSGGKKIQRNAANARERARMRVLSKAFSKLKTSLPWVPSDTKLSKLDTLRLAASYISHLRQILMEDTAQPISIHPITLTWPFHSRLPHQQEAPSVVECDNNENCDSSATFDEITPPYVVQCCNYQTYNTSQQEFEFASHFL